MKTAFIATSYKHQQDMSRVLDTISQALAESHYTPFIFVRHYAFDASETKLMMQTSFQHIRACDLFIAELSHKVVGVGIEAGYAVAQEKPVIYLRQSQAPPSTTMTGITDYRIDYQDTNHLHLSLGKLLFNLEHES